MIKFEKDNEVIEFENGRKAAEWLAEMYDCGDEKYGELLTDVAEPFGCYINNNWTAYDILCEPHHYDYDAMYSEWLEAIAYDIEHNYIEYFTNTEKNMIDTEHFTMDTADLLADVMREILELEAE